MEIAEAINELLAQHLCKKLEEFAKTRSVPKDAFFSMDHALAELLQNLVDHSGGNQAQVEMDFSNDLFKVTIRDNGKPYNLLDHRAVDMSIPFADRPVGGLGIHMIRKLMDQVTYQSSEGWNTTVFVKRTQASPPPEPPFSH